MKKTLAITTIALTAIGVAVRTKYKVNTYSLADNRGAASIVSGKESATVVTISDDGIVAQVLPRN